ncbi:MAG: DUF1330 domain-containing protein [Pseudomonadota bacterium]
MSQAPIGAIMIIQATITDPDRFVEYAKRTPALVTKYGGRYIAMRSELEVLEGEPDARATVLSAWPSMAAAREFWHSADYAAVKPYRDDAADVQVTLVECNGE